MAGVHFNYDSFKQLLRLSIGIAGRLDENRAESLTLLYCDFTDIDDMDVENSLQEVLRNSDSIINKGNDFYFVLPYTDKYGAETVRKMFADFFDKEFTNFVVSYPVDGEDAEELTDFLQNSVKKFCKKDITYLDTLA